MKVHPLNCGLLHAPPHPPAARHGLFLERDGRPALIDTGIGLQDVARPLERVGRAAIDTNIRGGCCRRRRGRRSGGYLCPTVPLGTPAAVVPVRPPGGGLPVGVQVHARRFADHWLVRVLGSLLGE